MFKSFFLVILIMVESAIFLMRRGIERGKFSATYNCYSLLYYYSIHFPEYFTEFKLEIGRNYTLIRVESTALSNEVLRRFRVPTGITFRIVYRPPPSEVNKFESDIYRNYCDELKSKFNGERNWYCSVGVGEKSCPVIGNIIYNLYFHLITDYIYPFLSNLSDAKFHIESCTPFMVRTRNITLLSSGVFSYRDRFSFSSSVVRFNIDCEYPSKSIRRAINRIISLM